MEPQKEIGGITFYPIPEFSDVAVVFGADAPQFFDRSGLADVPRKYEDMAQELFFGGGTLPDLHPRVDSKKEARAIRAWLCSFAPAHEAKIATVGYALWLWTDPDALND